MLDLNDTENCFEYLKGKSKSALIKQGPVSSESSQFVNQRYLVARPGNKAYDTTTYYVSENGTLLTSLVTGISVGVSETVDGIQAKLYYYPLVMNI